MSKVVLIKRGSVSDWVSCQSITSNIQKAYENLSHELEIVFLNNEDNQYDQWKLAQRISTFEPEFISFIDHQPNPQSLLKSLAHISQTLPKLIFHIFGDFTLQTNEWLELESILLKTPAKIIAASPKQAGLVSNLVQGDKSLIDVIPFPIDTDFFNFHSEERNKETTFLYTGRLSTQKNVLELITYFNQFNKNISQNCKLILAGPVDDLGIPFLGKNLNPGSYENTLEKQISQICNPNISILRNCSHMELKRLYLKADYFISLSTHNDEDYGMSPAEALCCGLPCILTDWGGFSAFKDYGETKLIPVTEKNERILPQAERLMIELTEAVNSKPDEGRRKQISETAQKLLSVSSYSEKLKKILSEENEISFKGFTPQMEMMAASHRINKTSPFFKGAQGGYSDLYNKIYNPYFN